MNSAIYFLHVIKHLVDGKVPRGDARAIGINGMYIMR